MELALIPGAASWLSFDGAACSLAWAALAAMNMRASVVWTLNSVYDFVCFGGLKCKVCQYQITFEIIDSCSLRTKREKDECVKKERVKDRREESESQRKKDRELRTPSAAV